MLEKIVLIFALFGSAKVALDMIASVFAKKDATPPEQSSQATAESAELNRIVLLLEEMTKKNEALQLRLAAVEAETSAVTIQQKAPKRVTKKTATTNTPPATATESVAKSIVDSITQAGPTDSFGPTPYYVDPQRFEVVIG